MPRTRPIKVMFVASYLPSHEDGSGVYCLALLQALKQAGMALEWISANSWPHGEHRWTLADRQLCALAEVRVLGNRRVGRAFFGRSTLYSIYGAMPEFVKRFYRRRLKKESLSAPGWSDCCQPAELAFVRERLQQSHPDVLVADYVWMADTLAVATPDTLRVLLAHDVVHERVASFSAQGMDDGLGKWTAETESAMLAKAQVLLAIQDAEAQTLKRLVPGSEVLVLPHPVVCQDSDSAQVAGRCLIVGSRATHNVYGLEWFLREVWPLVLRTAPHAELHVCGSLCAQIRGDYPRVRFQGYVPDLRAEYGAAQVCLVPSRVGSGLKIKLVEALSFGRACVSTSIGLQGLSDVAGQAVSRADTSEEFANAVALLLNDAEQRGAMERAARDLVRERFSPSAVCAPLVERINQHVSEGSASHR